MKVKELIKILSADESLQNMEIAFPCNEEWTHMYKDVYVAVDDALKEYVVMYTEKMEKVKLKEV